VLVLLLSLLSLGSGEMELVVVVWWWWDNDGAQCWWQPQPLLDSVLIE
jgi:hypothetical protein